MDRSVVLDSFRENTKAYISLNDTEWRVFSDALHVKTIARNEYFAASGRICSEIGFIIKGSVRYCNQVNGEEITGYFCFENSFVTAMKSYFTSEPSLYDIKTLEDTLFVTVSKKNLESLSVHPLLSAKVERFGRLISERFNILFEDRLKSFILKTPEERYLDLLQSGTDIINRVPVQYIAQYIGITPVSLSRIRKRIHASSMNESPRTK
jgi:CRP-like cAMP-binding protein